MNDDKKIVETSNFGMMGFWAFSILFLFCEFGERVTDRFDMFGDNLQRCDWYKLPFKMKRMYLIFLSDTQQSKNITTYANILNTRETFKKVIFYV